jgi:hypothetical protein
LGYSIECKKIKIDVDGIYCLCNVYYKGKKIGNSIGFVGNDEEKWCNMKRYAKISMVQTRAISRAGKNILGFIVKFLGEEYQSTPAEEIVSIQ